MNPVDTEI